MKMTKDEYFGYLKWVAVAATMLIEHLLSNFSLHNTKPTMIWQKMTSELLLWYHWEKGNLKDFNTMKTMKKEKQSQKQ